MRRGVLEDDRGQVSAELIVVIAALLAAAMFFVSSLNDTVGKAGEKMADNTAGVLEKIDEIGS